jgi:hypothetical protein
LFGICLGDYSNWWEPPHGKGQYWPPGFSNDTTVTTVEKIVRVHGYTVEADKDSRPETDAVAIYAIGSEWQHFAKFSNGEWKSKLGRGHDVSGVDLEDLHVSDYGEVVMILGRPKT